MALYDYKLLIDSASINNANVNSAIEINAGVANPHPKDIGLHVIVTTAYVHLVSMIIWVVHSASAEATTKLVGRYFTKAQLALGKHYFIPVPNNSLLQYVRVKYVITTNANAGALVTYFGPDQDGSE